MPIVEKQKNNERLTIVETHIDFLKESLEELYQGH